MSNFLFLKKNNENLFKIISEAEKLFRDEYFEQTSVQTRRFAENLCKDLLQDKVSSDDTFDSMIQKIKDNSFGNIRMKELADDLYFIKKHGNNSAHSISAKKDAEIALECLERAYEIAIFYSNTKFGYDKKLDETVFSEEMLMTGRATGKKSSPIRLKEKYSDELKKARTMSVGTKPKKLKTKPKVQKNVRKQNSKVVDINSKRKNKNKKEFPKSIIFFALFILIVLLGHYFL